MAPRAAIVMVSDGWPRRQAARIFLAARSAFMEINGAPAAVANHANSMSWSPLNFAFTCEPVRIIPGAQQAARPNIVLIYADDLGYGDTRRTARRPIRTPNIDRLAREGLRFTDAHAPSATCTPSRYSLLTGEYAWRQQGTGMLPGDAALIIDPGRATLPAMLQGRRLPHGRRRQVAPRPRRARRPDWNGEIKPGPLEIGFDYCFIMAATGDRVPSRLRRGRPRRRPRSDRPDPGRLRQAHRRRANRQGQSRTADDATPSHGHDMTIVNGISRIGYMTGGKAARWKDEDMADALHAQGGRLHRAAPARAVLPLLRHARHPRAARAAPALRRQDRAWARAATPSLQFDWSVGQVLRHARSAEARRTTRWSSSPATTARWSTTATTTRRWRSSGHTGRRVRCEAASTAVSRRARACRSWSAGRRA